MKRFCQIYVNTTQIIDCPVQMDQPWISISIQRNKTGHEPPTCASVVGPRQHIRSYMHSFHTEYEESVSTRRKSIRSPVGSTSKQQTRLLLMVLVQFELSLMRQNDVVGCHDASVCVWGERSTTNQQLGHVTTVTASVFGLTTLKHGVMSETFNRRKLKSYIIKKQLTIDVTILRMNQTSLYTHTQMYNILI